MFTRLIQKPHSTQNGADSDERRRYNDTISSLRKAEYPMLRGITYLDHAGTTLPAASLINAVSAQQKKLLLANPHSALSSTPNLTKNLTQQTRLKVLTLFNASPEHFEVIFVANATAATKLVFDTFRDQEHGFEYYYHRDCHTSLIGGRELASVHGCFNGDAADETTERWLRDGNEIEDVNAVQRPKLFAYPAQSNMNGRRLPLHWPSVLRKGRQCVNTFVLLDVAAYVSTSPLDLSNHEEAPDFVTMSFYKIFGFPNLGALIVRKAAAHIFDRRRYFGGGTTDMITCNENPWVAKKKSLCDALEDGTGSAHSILALFCAIDIHKGMYGGLEQCSKHTSWLGQQLYEQLSTITHTNGRPVCVIYKDQASTYGDPCTQGGTVAFNVRTADGRYLDTALVSNEAMAHNIHIRAGGLCNPAGMTHALGFTDDEVRRIYDSGLRCGEGSNWTGTPLGMVRASMGACSTLEDVSVLIRFIRRSFVDRVHGGNLKTTWESNKGMKLVRLSQSIWQISTTLTYEGIKEQGKKGYWKFKTSARKKAAWKFELTQS